MLTKQLKVDSEHSKQLRISILCSKQLRASSECSEHFESNVKIWADCQLADVVDNLKTKMLIKMNIIRFEQIDIIILKKQAVIRLCKNIIIFIEVHLHSCFIKHTIYIKFNIIISSHIKQSISVHYIKHLSELNFLFESENFSNLTLFTHMINSSLSVIITHNKSNQTISIWHNQCLDYLTELNYEDCYHIVSDKFTYNLVIQ